MKTRVMSRLAVPTRQTQAFLMLQSNSIVLLYFNSEGCKNEKDSNTFDVWRDHS